MKIRYNSEELNFDIQDFQTMTERKINYLLQVSDRYKLRLSSDNSRLFIVHETEEFEKYYRKDIPALVSLILYRKKQIAKLEKLGLKCIREADNGDDWFLYVVNGYSFSIRIFRAKHTVSVIKYETESTPDTIVIDIRNKDLYLAVEQAQRYCSSYGLYAESKCINYIINSDITAYQIEKDTKIPRQTISMLRNNKAEIKNLSFDVASRLTQYYYSMV